MGSSSSRDSMPQKSDGSGSSRQLRKQRPHFFSAAKKVGAKDNEGRREGHDGEWGGGGGGEEREGAWRRRGVTEFRSHTYTDTCSGKLVLRGKCLELYTFDCHRAIHILPI